MHTVLALILWLSPRLPVPLATAWAQAIADATPDADERRQLVLTARAETGFSRVRGTLMGCMRRTRPETLEDATYCALRVLRAGARQCGAAGPRRFAYYLSGACWPRARPGASAAARHRVRLMRREALRRVRDLARLRAARPEEAVVASGR